MNTIVKSSLLSAGLAFALTALADAPSSLHLPDTHSDMNTGKITLYRSQIKDYKFGKNEDITNNEVFITLDTTGEKIFTLSLHEDPVVNTEIATTLREAFVHDMTVTIYASKFVKEGGAMKIHAVQIERPAGK
ncbi:MAG: hypothetical protein IPM20_09605 [Gammaproteobacteria bacterium]|nr:hypothetical protein [Gammaproteobacteria bacterium]